MIKHASRIWIGLLIVLVVAAGITAVVMLRANLLRAAEPDATVTWTCSPNLVVSANTRVVDHC
jgi:hypothetical protein